MILPRHCTLQMVYLNEQGINKNCIVTVNETGSTGIPATEITNDKDRSYTNRFVDKSKPSQEILERSNTRSTTGNLIQGNWKLITTLLLVLSCIVLSITYCQPTFIRIREFLTRLMSASKP